MIEIDGNRITEKALPGVESDVVATFGRSAETGSILAGFQGDDGISLFMATVDDPNSWTFLSPAVVGAQWAPVGNTYLFHTLAGELNLAGPEGSKRIADGVRAASFSPDGTKIALIRTGDFSSSDDSVDLPRRRIGAASAQAPRGRRRDLSESGLFLYNVATGEETLLSSQVINDWWYLGYAPSWSPDGNQILFVSGWSAADGAPTLSIASLAPRQTYLLHLDAPVPDPSTPFYWSPNSRRIFVGSEALDADTAVWVVDLHGAGIANAKMLTAGRPILRVNDDLLIESSEGTVLLDTMTLESRRAEYGPAAIQSDAAVAATAKTPSLYDVKYCTPLKSMNPSSYVSHSSGSGGCNDGTNKYDCKPNTTSKDPARPLHKGTDLRAALGTNIYAAAKGTVSVVKTGCGSTTACQSTKETCNGSAGNYVWIKHSNGAISKYMHMQKAKMKGSESVTPSTIIGYVGSTGHSSGCHLHFQVDFKDAWRDPYYGKCSCTTESLWTTSGCSR
ncbi:MAG TPA: peptidoglycan DD-metalloendopeptidase family protein [Thermoanaerobaculia bacterium]|jgi:murein DD-endopeptidase MepM/ murein hydrolase activator NlpD